VAIAVAFCAMFAAFLFLTFYLQQNLGYSPLKTGVAFLPLSAGIAMSAGLANGLLVPRLGPRPLIPVGMLIAAGGMFWLSHLTLTSTYNGDVLVPLFVLGAGVRMTFVPALDAATAGVANTDAGVASAMVNTSQQIGGAVGTAALSTVFASALKRYVTGHLPPTADVHTAAAIHGYTTAFLVSCGLFLGGMVITALLLRSGRLPDHAELPVASDERPDTDPPTQVLPVQRFHPPAGPRPGLVNGANGIRGSASSPRRNRAAELIERGINRDGVALILDLEFRNAQLEAENRNLIEHLY